jgi:hypothetical protein
MINQQTEIKNCLLCNKTIRGRVDKKFCNDYCRNGFNNQLKSGTNNLVRNTNNFLGKNRRILENILPEGETMIKIKKEKLLQEGFFFKYTTQIHKNKKGSIYYYCYDYGYLPLDSEWYLIIKNELD